MHLSACSIFIYGHIWMFAREGTIFTMRKCLNEMIIKNIQCYTCSKILVNLMIDILSVFNLFFAINSEASFISQHKSLPTYLFICNSFLIAPHGPHGAFRNTLGVLKKFEKNYSPRQNMEGIGLKSGCSRFKLIRCWFLPNVSPCIKVHPNQMTNTEVENHYWSVLDGRAGRSKMSMLFLVQY